MFLSSPIRLLQQIQAVATNLDFEKTHPFHNGLFLPIIQWVREEQGLLGKIRTEKLNDSELERCWQIISKDFTGYRKGIRSAYLKLVKETYKKAGLRLEQ